MERGVRVGSRQWSAQYECPVYVNSCRPLRAKRGHSRRISATGQFDPELPFEIGLMNGR